VVVVALGLGFTGWARLHLGRFWSGSVTLKAEPALIRSGPYLVLFVVGFTIKIRQEERLLLEHFGAAYRAYQTEVPMLVPRFSR